MNDFIVSDRPWWIYAFILILVAIATGSVVSLANLARVFHKGRVLGVKRTPAMLMLFTSGSLLRLAMLILSLVALWLFLNDTHLGFVRVKIVREQIVLTYLWPRPSERLLRSEIQAITSKAWGRGASVVQISLKDGRVVRSVSGDVDIIRGICDDLLSAQSQDMP